MSEAETMELIAIFAANSINGFAIFASLTFSYLAVAYVVGGSLTKFQALAASGLYIVSGGAAVYAPGRAPRRRRNGWPCPGRWD
ncbi:MAG: hypothetical protein ACI915_003365 [Gammaproteobacteria bacterium]|jgi:hypothetical protein